MKRDPQEPFWRIGVDEAKEMIDKACVQVVDVREQHEYAAGHIAGSRLVPLGTVLARAAELSLDQPMIMVCAAGIRSAAASEMVCALGWEEVYNMEGGMEEWTKRGYPVEK
ncbi:MAG: rhodanese-like domain-containing protein [Chloroflexi bacterium]|nr:rhodanese-like domain-containing protein [Chloroflexota bacterium]